jgi:hypothetical protein
MAKATATETTAPQIVIEAYRPVDREGIYDAYVQALLDAESDYPEGEYPSVTIQVPNGEKNAKGEYMERAKHIRFFQDSAKRAKRTARLVADTPRDNGDGSSTLKFILRSAIKRTRKPASVDAPETGAVESNDTPETAAA